MSLRKDVPLYMLFPARRLFYILPPFDEVNLSLPAMYIRTECCRPAVLAKGRNYHNIVVDTPDC